MLSQVLIGSLSAGAVYALVALGFVLVYKGTGIVHFGYGEQVTLGAYLVLIAQTTLDLHFVGAAALALMLSAAFGVALFLLLHGALGRASLWARIIATLAVGMALREGLRSTMGPSAWPFPFLLSQDPVSVAGLQLVPANLAIIAVACAALAMLFLFLERTMAGRATIAACENRTGAQLVGIRVHSVWLAIWVMASMLASVAGILVAPQLTLSPEMGLIAIKGFTAAALGGFASLPGAVLGGVLLGVLEALAGVYASSALKDMVSYAVLFAVMIALPHGLLGRALLKKV